MWLENARSIRDASGIRRMKSDRSDASMIAEYAMRYCDKAVIFEPLGESLYQLHELFLYRQVLMHRCCFQVRRGEKELTMEKSLAQTMISQSGRHVVSMLNKEIEKLDKRIAELTDSEAQGHIPNRDLSAWHRMPERGLPDGLHGQLPQVQPQFEKDCMLLWHSPLWRGFGHQRAYGTACASHGKSRSCCRPSDSIRFFPDTICGLGRGERRCRSH